jgi:DNA-binding transcriptional MocR family regulator
VRAVALETDGIDVDALADLLGGLEVGPTLAHVIPNFHNPAGYTLSAEKRSRLLALAAEHDFTLFEDDPYRSVRFEGEGLPTMLSQDEAGKVVYASSFSKTVCPGVRVGYLVGPQAVISQVQALATNTYISPNMVAQSIVYQFCRSGRLEEAVARVRTALRERRDALVVALERELPEARFTPPQGGYFMWVELPEEFDVVELERAARERGVVFVKGSDFLLEGGGSTLRLAYSGVTPEQIDEGIMRLAQAARSLRVAA